MMRAAAAGTVYLIHFDIPYKHARHYIGYSDHVSSRIEAHRHDCGARLLQVINAAGISWSVSRTWKNVPQSFERHLKRSKNGPRFCPVCNPTTALNCGKAPKPATPEPVSLKAWRPSPQQQPAKSRTTQAAFLF